MNQTEIEINDMLKFYRPYADDKLDINIALCRYYRGVDLDRSFATIIMKSQNQLRQAAFKYGEWLSVDDLIDALLQALDMCHKSVQRVYVVKDINRLIDHIQCEKVKYRIHYYIYLRESFIQILRYRLRKKRNDSCNVSLDNKYSEDDDADCTLYNLVAKWDDHDYLPFYQYISTIDDIHYKYYLWYIINYQTTLFIDNSNYRYCVDDFARQYGYKPVLPDKLGHYLNKLKQIAYNDNNLRELLGLDYVIPKKIKPISVTSGKSSGRVGAPCKRVINIDTGEIFDSVSDAAKSVDKPIATVSANLNGRSKSCGGYHFKYVD